MHLIVTRPLEDATPLKAKLETLGHTVVACPLLEIVPRPGVDIPLNDYQFAVATSANAIRALAADLTSLRILTVGPQSLWAARHKGFTNAEAHGGDVTGLAAYIAANFKPEDGAILYLAGAETSGGLQDTLQQAGFAIERVVLYDAVPAISLGPAADDLRHGKANAVLLYSPRSAKIWRALMEAGDLARQAGGLMHFCLSANIAAVLPQHWRSLVAAQPDEAAMLALLDQKPGTV